MGRCAFESPESNDYFGLIVVSGFRNNRSGIVTLDTDLPFSCSHIHFFFCREINKEQIVVFLNAQRFVTFSFKCIHYILGLGTNRHNIDIQAEILKVIYVYRLQCDSRGAFY